jgi:hypothetical protein
MFPLRVLSLGMQEMDATKLLYCHPIVNTSEFCSEELLAEIFPGNKREIKNTEMPHK